MLSVPRRCVKVVNTAVSLTDLSLTHQCPEPVFPGFFANPCSRGTMIL